MGNQKSITELTMADLKTAADFVDDGIPVPAHEHDRAVGADDPVVVPESKAINVSKSTIEELLASNATATPEGRARVAELFGIRNTEHGDEVIDIPNRESFDALVEMTGGKEMLKQSGQDLREVVALAGDIDLDEELAGLTDEEANAKIASEIKGYREVLANPMKAQALLAEIYAHPMREPGRSYFMGKGSPALNDAIAKLWQAASGTLVTGRARAKGDGWIK